MENSMAVPQKIKNRTVIGSSNFTSRYQSRGNEASNSKRHSHPMFITALFTTATMWSKSWFRIFKIFPED